MQTFPVVRRLLLGIAAVWAVQVQAAECMGQGIELQVLGSGGPEMQGKRASSSYLIWRDGKARVLVDSGGGSALRFGQAGAQMADLDIVLFTHLHVDHSADFPALVKSSYFEHRRRPLPVLGPPGSEAFPSIIDFVRGLFDEKHGIYRYLSDYLTGGESSYAIQPREIKLKPGELAEVFADADFKVMATPVTHGRVPAVAWRVEIGGHALAFSGDTSGDGALAKLAARTDIFVAHNAVPEGATGIERKLHMPPSVIGEIAKAASVKKLVLSHRMLRTLGQEPRTLESIAKVYTGPTVFADDLDCFGLRGK